jgi:protein-disulfide isomerase
MILLALPLAAALLPQHPPGSVEPCTMFASEPAPCTTPAAPPRGTLAVLDGEYVTVQDLDPKVRPLVEALGGALAEARMNALRSAVNDELYALEAESRHVPVKQLYWTEVAGRVAAPTPEEIKAEIAAHPDKYARGDDETKRLLAQVRLLDERETKLADALVSELSKKTPVTGLRQPEPADTPDVVLAVVGGKKLTAAALHERIETAAYLVAIKVYREERSALDRALHDMLVRREAARRGMKPEDVTRAEVGDKLVPPTDAELNAIYEKYKTFFGPDKQKAWKDVVEYAGQERKNEADAAFDRRLREGRAIRVLLEPPVPVLQTISIAGSPAQGPADARATLVEFGDFECPPCGRMWPVVEEALKPYAGRVKYVFRENPLPFHPFAWKAAEAALAAHAQGKFFAMANVLFKSQNALDVASLKKYARQVGLDGQRFDRELDSGRWAPDVRQDKREGLKHGVTGTPAFFVNGRPLENEEYTVVGIRAALERALGAGGHGTHAR